MKMNPGFGSISDYGQYISNCQLKQMPYKVPVNSLADVQLYINIGASRPATVEYQLINTCGPNGGNIETIIPTDYIIGQEKSNNWYGVFKNFTGVPATCFVIAITFTFAGESGESIYFSEEYCIEPSCNSLTPIKGCYGNLDNSISTDCEGVYFGTHAGTGIPLGDTSIVYKHQLLLRGVEVTLSAIKNSFKQGRTRNFRTEKEKIFQFWAELVPEWYLPEIDSVFYRGEAYIGEIKYLLNETQFEKVEECYKQWKPVATFKESCLQSFSCEADPCADADTACCDPVVLSAVVTEITNAMNTIVVECVVDETPVITGTASPVTGITNGSTVVTCAAFAGVRVVVERGHFQIGGIDPLDGSAYYTKNLADDFITFNNGPLVNGEFIYIQTIPS